MKEIYIDPTSEWCIFKSEYHALILLSHETCDAEVGPAGSITYIGAKNCWRCGIPIPEEVRRKFSFLREMESL